MTTGPSGRPRAGWGPRAACVLGLALGLAGCRAVVPPTVAPGGPRFPELVYPTVPAGEAPASVVTEIDRGWRLLQAGDLRGADRAWSAVLRRSPELYPAAVALACLDLARKDGKPALDRVDRVLETRAGYAPALVARGNALVLLKRDEDAVDAFARALAADPSLADVGRRLEVLRFRGAREAIDEARRAAQSGRLDEAATRYQRAIEGSPDSAFLYREAGDVERRRQRAVEAEALYRRAVDLDAGDIAAWIGLADVLESRADLAGASQALAERQKVDPDPGVIQRLEQLAARIELAAMPEAYRAIPGLAQTTRGDLAALLGTRLGSVLQAARRREAVVLTDTRTHWAAAWITAVTRAGVMEAFPNHTFQPRAVIHRSDLAQVVSRVLDVLATRHAALARGWTGQRIKIADLGPGHLSYPAASAAVAAGILPLGPGGVFQPTRTVPGDELIDAVQKLEGLARKSGIQ